MQLCEIKETTCPECGSIPIQESKKDKHTNGHFNETRVFECGSSLKFSPNFMQTTTGNECPKSKKSIKFEKLRTDAKQKLDIFTDALKVDERFKARVKESYKYI